MGDVNSAACVIWHKGGRRYMRTRVFVSCWEIIFQQRSTMVRPLITISNQSVCRRRYAAGEARSSDPLSLERLF